MTPLPLNGRSVTLLQAPARGPTSQQGAPAAASGTRCAGEREVGAAIRAGADAFYGPRSVAHPRYVQVRDLILTSMRGVGMTYAFDPRDPDTDPHLPLWKGLARTLLE